MPATQQVVKQEVTDLCREADLLGSGRAQSSDIAGGGSRRLG
ncbi:MAG TPA: hypothetical protein VMW80_06765 [Candidatus Dormibacteraeota bacterium]|nr:hypothetical protein [Candidatus Dormibacteraeota bacterium]